MSDASTAARMDFTGRVAAVTGGASGIGKGVCEAFAALGADMAVVDVAADAAESVATDLESDFGVDAVAVETDVSEYEDAAAMVETVVDELGRLDCLVNNAGIGESKPFAETDPDDWDRTIGVCHYGTLNCSHAALDHMTGRGSGVIVNFASDSFKGNDPGLAVYGAAKAANVSFTKTLSNEVGDDGVRVNCVSPGTTRTPATEDWIDEHEEGILRSYALSRIGDPSDIADAVVFLCSDAADWVTGQVLSVNGGYIRG
ncbi:SDR family NAD(P)-dependent oxidoreductase [Halomarina litorea]|uniref:SDR family NAD(P)-dependent oxidoreductase n=1 Tax=Halomarina litorea TaxID=2961595 RepID=UPI0020C39801|nr:glucose 1-dehydrogenase [Halomarina sp. BCD28]